MNATKELHMNSIPKLSNRFRKFRIIRDKYCGYSVQCWRLWWPFWMQYDYVNTFRTVKECVEFVKHNNEVVRYL